MRGWGAGSEGLGARGWRQPWVPNSAFPIPNSESVGSDGTGKSIARRTFGKVHGLIANLHCEDLPIPILLRSENEPLGIAPEKRTSKTTVIDTASPLSGLHIHDINAPSAGTGMHRDTGSIRRPGGIIYRKLLVKQLLWLSTLNIDHVDLTNDPVSIATTTKVLECYFS